MRPLTCSLTAALAGTIAMAGPARAEDENAKAQAKSKLEQGARLLESGDYAQALDRFQEAYRLVPSPKIFFNLGLAETGLARYPDALRSFERFVGEAHNATAANLAEAREQIAMLQKRVATIDVQCAESGLEIVIDGRSQGRTPLGAGIYLDPGAHQLVAQGAAGTPPRVQAFTAAAGARQSVIVLAAPGGAVAGPPPATTGAGPRVTLVGGGPETAPPGESERPPASRRWIWGAAAGAVLVAGAIAGFLLFRSPSYPDPSLGRHQF